MTDAPSRPTSSRPPALTAADNPRRALLALAAGFAVAAVVFSLWPGIDLWASGFFYVEGKGFPGAKDPVLSATRMVVWRLSIAMSLLSLVCLAIAASGRRRPFGIPRGTWGFIVLLYLIGPGLIVDGLLKRFWGRARPAQITDFGGEAHFTPALLPTDQCSENCSFVSGEGSGAVALAVAVFAIVAALGPRLPRAWAFAARATAVVIAFIGLALRVVTGRHFVSDSVFAALIVLAVALALRPLLRRQAGQGGT